MHHFTLRKYTNDALLHEGRYNSFVDCLEDAVAQNIPLSYINLRNQNLTNANLDNAYMPYADFYGSNLSGANLSETILHDANFENTSLYNCCLSHSDLKNCNFCDASFGATLINGATLQNCKFSTLSSLDLDFTQCCDTSGCHYITPENKHYGMSGIPIVIKGLFNTPIIIFDEKIRIGDMTIERSNMPKILKFITGHNHYLWAENHKKMA